MFGVIATLVHHAGFGVCCTDSCSALCWGIYRGWGCVVVGDVGVVFSVLPVSLGVTMLCPGYRGDANFDCWFRCSWMKRFHYFHSFGDVYGWRGHVKVDLNIRQSRGLRFASTCPCRAHCRTDVPSLFDTSNVEITCKNSLYALIYSKSDLVKLCVLVVSITGFSWYLSWCNSGRLGMWIVHWMSLRKRCTGWIHGAET
jgi:hypothetical protein